MFAAHAQFAPLICTCFAVMALASAAQVALHLQPRSLAREAVNGTLSCRALVFVIFVYAYEV